MEATLSRQTRLIDVATLNDDQTLATLSSDNTIKIWDINSQQSVGKISLSTSGIVRSLAISADEKTLFVSDNQGKVELVTLSKFEENYSGTSTGKLSIESVVNQIESLSDFNNLILLATESGKVEVWDYIKQAKITSTQAHQGPALFATINPESNLIASTGADNLVKIWKVNTGNENGEIPNLLSIELSATLYGHTDKVTQACFLPDSPKRLFSAGGDTTIKLWNIAESKQENVNRELLTLRGHSGEITSLQFDPKTEYLISGSRDKTTIIWPVSKK